MELTAVVRALDALTEPCWVIVRTDSEFVTNRFIKARGGIEYLQQTRRWKNMQVKYQDLWQRLIDAAKPHAVRWEWVRGHSTDEYNRAVDQMANRARLLGAVKGVKNAS